ncbi:hypothetical protein DUNSADRAFT_9014 [Dunaliella salina]|uniref:Uncharacterized protein n=1 Tax=Dunaliella salina TaxID=3046 RepID=A0ABQ7GIC3_DUNSA|nr:hypothetical protein DUNSADRAFT_9014 [Dunaliella salina]|eukprot:KAF5834351.1 hypothetical protein DUNSADRAFT_9014 [Dunaliella salina]
MAEAPQIQECLEPLVAGAHEQLHNLRKYEDTFSPESRASLQDILANVDRSLAATRAWVPHSGTSAYLSTGSQKELGKALATVLQQLNTVLAGGFPLPRASKEELTNFKDKLTAAKPMISIPEDRLKVESRLLELYACGVEKCMDPDVIESQVDQLTQQVLGELYGESHLDEEDLQRELEWLVEAVEKFGGRGHWQVYSLTLNSLERLHAVRAEPDEEEQTEEPDESVCEDGDEDDPFFMPVPIGALKMADAKKFAVLAEPIGQPPDGQSKPMLELKEDSSSKHSRSNAENTGSVPMPVLTADDYEQVPNQQHEASEGQQAPQAPSAADPALDAAQEKLARLSKFLQGENQGSCTFHAQMRLSQEGCQKLATFLEHSGRIRALSLSANYLGDESIKLICAGLRKNKTVAAIDLPNNNITDEGAFAIAEAISDNKLIIQLELGANKIGDRGATAIAKVLQSNANLKKVGFAYNKIGREGCLALAEAARANPCIKQIQVLPGNPIQERDAKTLAKAIQKNKKQFSIRSLFNIPNQKKSSADRRASISRAQSSQRTDSLSSSQPSHNHSSPRMAALAQQQALQQALQQKQQQAAAKALLESK